jgi:hypothetical protein
MIFGIILSCCLIIFLLLPLSHIVCPLFHSGMSINNVDFEKSTDIILIALLFILFENTILFFYLLYLSLN